MSLVVRFLGTSSARPTAERGLSSLVVVREGETLMFDCGEGTQRQMTRHGVTFALGDIFLTHLHADHVLGLPGLLATMALQDLHGPVRVWGPPGTARFLERLAAALGGGFGPRVEAQELRPGDSVPRRGYTVTAYAAAHRGPALGYAHTEPPRRGRFDPERARAFGVPEGPLWGRLHAGETVTLANGRMVQPATLVGPERPGRIVVISGDTRPTDATVDVARGADLLVHEATFSDDEAGRAAETGHSTAREAGRVAARAGVRRLAITHFSARFSHDTSALACEAREEFPHVVTARDGMEIDVPFPDAAEEAPANGT